MQTGLYQSDISLKNHLLLTQTATTTPHKSHIIGT